MASPVAEPRSTPRHQPPPRGAAHRGLRLGRLSGGTGPLELERLEAFRRLGPEKPQALREALAALAPHLDDRMVLVRRLEVGEGGDSRLAVFTAPDATQTPCWVLVTGGGRVTAGRADLQGRARPKLQRLEGFDPSQHRVLSVAVTGRFRLLGERLDLWIVVRSLTSSGRPEDDTRVYHGLVAFDADGEPVLEPSRDDWGKEGGGRWRPAPPGRLPEWLRRWELSCGPDTDPFETPPEKALEKLAELEATHAEGIAPVAWAGGCFGFAAAGEVRLAFQGRGYQPVALDRPVGERVELLALAEGPYSSVVGLTASDTRRLLAFHVTQAGKKEKSWGQIQRDFPVHAAFLPSAVRADEEEPPWPDVLVAYRGGAVERLRFVGPEAVYGVWGHLWEQLGLGSAQDRIEAGKELLKAPDKTAESWRRAALVGVVEALLREAPQASEKVRGQWVEKVATLFSTDESLRVLRAALGPLLQSLAQWFYEDREPWPVPGCCDLAVALVHKIYMGHESAHVELLAQVDRELRSFEAEGHPATQDEKFKGLLGRCRRNRDDIWSEPEPATDAPKDLIYRSLFGLERWSSAYLDADTAHLGRRKPGERVYFSALAGFVTRDSQGKGVPWLAVAHRDRVAVHALQGTTKLRIDAEAEHRRLEAGSVRALMRVPQPGGDLLLMSDTSGALRLLRYGAPKKGKKKAAKNAQSVLEPLAELRVEEAGTAGVLRCLATPSGEALVAAGYSSPRGSELVVCRVAGEKLELVSRTSLDLPSLRCLDLAAAAGGGFHVLVGAAQGVPVRLYRLSRDGKLKPKEEFQLGGGGNLAARFEQPEKPGLFAVGDRDGFLWCVDLEAAGSSGWLRWTYKLDSAIRHVTALRFKAPGSDTEEPHFLVSCESGRVALLRAADGRRIWKHRVLSPIQCLEEIQGSHGPALAIGMRGGWVALLVQIRDREEANSRTHDYLESLQTLSLKKLKRNRDTETVFALLKLKPGEGASFDKVLRDIRGRERRARVLRYLVEKLGPPPPAECRRIVGELSGRDLMLLLSYLPAGWNDCETQLRDEIYRHDTFEDRGDRSESAAMAALVTWLQRLGARHPATAEIKTEKPPQRFFKYPWVRVEYARLLLQSMAREIGGEAMERGRLLGRAIPCLLELPSELVSSCAEVLPRGSEARRDFEILNELVSNLSEPGPPAAESLLHFAESLDLARGKSRALGLIAAMATFHGSLLDFQQAEDEEWHEGRVEVLGALRRLAGVCTQPPPAPPFAEILADGLRTLLPASPLPEDQEKQETRLSWLQQTQERLVHASEEFAVDDRQPWKLGLEGWLKALREALRTVVRRETDHVLAEVRPVLELVGLPEMDESSQVRLRLEVTPEGRRQLSDVTIRLDAAGDEGLRPPPEGGQAEKLEFGTYPGDSTPREVELRGFADPDQEHVCVRVTLWDRLGYESRGTWSFPLTEAGPYRALAGSLPFASRHVLSRVLDSRAPVVLAVIDRALGRDAVVKGWLEATGGVRVDLDAALRETGRGRTYSERAFGAEAIEQALASAEAGSPERKPLLVTPMGEVIERLVAGEAPGQLALWMETLRRRCREPDAPQRVLVVTALQACRLRALGLGEIEEIAAHHLLRQQGTGHTLVETPELREVVGRVARETGLGDTAARVRVEELGGDLALILQWLQWAERLPVGTHPETPEFLKQPRALERLKAELAALDALDLLIAVVGAEAETAFDLGDLKPGLIAAQDHFSTAKQGRGKRIQERGAPFTDRSLSALRSDARPPNRVRVEGLGAAGTAGARRTRLLSVVGTRGREQRQASFRRLAERGLGTWAGGIFRTGAPYRQLIRGFYDRFAELPDKNRDAAVYQELVGAGRSLLEGLSLSDLAAMPVKDLRQVMPEARAEDLKSLTRIARQWTGREEGEALGALSAVFSPKPVQIVSTKAKKWEQPLLSFGLPVYGVGLLPETDPPIPEDYVIWVAGEQGVDLAELGDAVEEAERLRPRSQEGEPPPPLRLSLLGPGVEGLPTDSSRRVAVLRAADLSQAAWEGNLGEELLRKARAQMRLTALSPFQTIGPLPPGSPIFFGREAERIFIETHLRQVSILVVGGRRVGKTSLLNQVRHWARREKDLEPIYLDLQNVRSREAFVQALRSGLESPDNPTETKKLKRVLAGSKSMEGLQAVVAAVRKRGKLPVFLLNEIDGLQDDRELIGEWRSLSESNQARFVMAAYSTIAQLGSPDSPFFHFTQGTSFGGKAVAPTALSETAAKKLLGLLTDSQLGLRWQSPQEQEKAAQLLLEHSYRIPWVLQHFCRLLVQRLEDERQGVLTLNDVELVLRAEGGVLWQYIENIDYESLGYTDSEQGKHQSVRRPGYQLVLFALARKHYFLGGEGAPVRDRGLRDRSPLAEGLGFTVSEARETVKQTLAELLDELEREEVGRWFDRLQLDQALRLLTLTLTLEPDPVRGDRYGFLMHILPLELSRKYRSQDPTLDSLIVDKAVEFLRLRSEAG